MINDYSSISGKYKFFSSRPRLKDLIITSPQQKGKIEESEKLVQHLNTLVKRKPSKKSKAQQFKLYHMVKSKQIVSEFLMKLRQKAQQISFSNLQKNPIFQKERYLFEKRNQPSQKYLDALIKFPLFKPQSKKCLFFDAFSFLLILITLWAYPFMFSFLSFDNTNIKIFIQFQLLAEILFNCNKITYQEGQLVNERKKLIQIYFKQQGVIDLLFLISNALIIFDYSNIYVQIFTILLIIFRLNEKVRLYQDNLYLQGTIPEFIDLILLLVTIYYFTHIVACSWYKVGTFSDYLGTNWIQYKQLQNECDWVKYNTAFYWATMTMTTIGYGDVSAQNQLEIVFSNIIMIISSFLFGYSINSMGTIIRNQYEKNQQYKYVITSITIRRSILILNTYMKNNQVSQNIQNRVRNYLKYYLREKFNQTLQEVDNITQILPLSLKYDLNQNIKIKIVNQIPVLKNNFRPQTLTNIAENFEFLQFTPNELIYQQNSHDRYLYFVVDGNVTLQESKSNLVLQQIEKGGLFGNYQFFTNFNPKQTAISDGFVQLCRISREKFIQCLKIQQEFQIFKNIQDQIIFNRDFSCAFMKCNLCGKTDHENIDCQSINYYPDIEKIVKSENFKVNRRRFVQRQNQRVNTLLNLKTISDCADQWAEQNSIYTQSNISDIESEDKQYDQTSDVPDDKSIGYKPDTIHHKQRQKNTINIIKSKNNIMSMSHLSKHGSKSILLGARNTILYQTAGNIKKIQDLLIFDKLFNYINYFPHNNLDQTILQTGKKKQTSLKFKEYLAIAGKYMFYYMPRMMSTKIQMKLRRKLSSPF